MPEKQGRKMAGRVGIGNKRVSLNYFVKRFYCLHCASVSIRSPRVIIICSLAARLNGTEGVKRGMAESRIRRRRMVVNHA